MNCIHKEKCCFYQPYNQDLKECRVIDRRNHMTGRSTAFGDTNTQYYKLLIDIGRAKKGTIFYYDPDDNIRGSVGAGCLKLAWRKDGNCQCEPMLCGDTIIFHASFRNDKNVFAEVEHEQN